ncbi:MAG: hypothetical protein Q4D19_14280 [Lautropia sp.]|nr:hypothetical protein [Lautropia sp.]
MAGMDAAYLKSLEQFLEAEAEMARQGVDLLNDPEYRTLRELYIDGEIDQEEFLGRIEALAESRPDEGEMPYTALDEADEALAEADGWPVDEEDDEADEADEPGEIGRA